jgi:hypothetical protein
VGRDRRPARRTPDVGRLMDAVALARAAGVPSHRVERMVALGLLHPGPDDEHGPSQIQLVRVLEALDAAGLELATLGEMVARGEYATTWGANLWPEPVQMSGQTLAELAAELGIDVDIARRTFIACRFAAPTRRRAPRGRGRAAADLGARPLDDRRIRRAGRSRDARGDGVDRRAAAARGGGADAGVP